MNFLSLLGGGFTKTVSNLVDNLHTSEELCSPNCYY